MGHAKDVYDAWMGGYPEPKEPKPEEKKEAGDYNFLEFDEKENTIPKMPRGWMFLSVSLGIETYYAEIRHPRSKRKSTAFGDTIRQAVINAIEKI